VQLFVAVKKGRSCSMIENNEYAWLKVVKSIYSEI